MDNMQIYKMGKEVPAEAKKTIAAGRLKGMTDVNPMWRIKKLTELFGACGFGWYTEVVEQWLETGAKNEIVAFCNINLYVKYDNEWSKPIFGSGGSKFVIEETKGLFTSDECYKMAYTDALSVACKALGIGADVYYEKDRTKYDNKQQQETGNQKPKEEKPNEETPKPKLRMIANEDCLTIVDLASKTGTDMSTMLAYYKVKSVKELSAVQAEHCIKSLNKKLVKD